MVEVIEKKEPHFRIQIYDLINKKSRSITVANNRDVSVEDIREVLVTALKEYQKYINKEELQK